MVQPISIGKINKEVEIKNSKKPKKGFSGNKKPSENVASSLDALGSYGKALVAKENSVNLPKKLPTEQPQIEPPTPQIGPPTSPTPQTEQPPTPQIGPPTSPTPPTASNASTEAPTEAPTEPEEIPNETRPLGTVKAQKTEHSKYEKLSDEELMDKYISTSDEFVKISFDPDKDTEAEELSDKIDELSKELIKRGITNSAIKARKRSLST